MLRRSVTPLLSHHEFMEIRRFPAIDGVRAVAALMVVYFHFAGPDWWYLSGWLGVQLFFVLSGFLITTLLLREMDSRGSVSLRSFWIRRVFRILPAYYVALAVTVVLAILRDQWVNAGGPSSIWWFLSVTPEFAPTELNFGQAWTIGYEQKFYLLWPLVGFVLVTKPLRRTVVWAVALIGLLAWCFWWLSAVHFAVILLGCGMAMVMHHGLTFRVVRWLTAPVGMIATVSALVYVQMHVQEWSLSWGSQGPPILIYGVLASLLLPVVCATSWLSRLLSLRPMVWLGERSYSIYLVQVIAGSVVVAMLPESTEGPPHALIVGIVCCMLADLMYRWVEQPMIAIGRRLTTRGRRVAGRPPESTMTPAGRPEVMAAP